MPTNVKRVRYYHAVGKKLPDCRVVISASVQMPAFDKPRSNESNARYLWLAGIEARVQEQGLFTLKVMLQQSMWQG
jgi:alpha-D-ribose 1-methylphosphonate 5-phosphate C-P lyase